MKITVAVSAVLALLTVISSARAAEIVDATDVATALKRDAIVWDVRSVEEYAAGHIPGAVNIGVAPAVLRNPNTEDLLSVAEVEPLLNAGGIDLGQGVIVYATRGHPYAYWTLTMVRQLGGKNVKVFHGGIDAWQAAGHPMSTEATTRPAVDQKITIDPTVQVYLAEVASKVGSPDVQFIDARTPAEFNGDVIAARRGGHIPGARNIPFEQNWIAPDAAATLAHGDTTTRDGMALKSRCSCALCMPTWIRTRKPSSSARAVHVPASPRRCCAAWDSTTFACSRSPGSATATSSPCRPRAPSS